MSGSQALSVAARVSPCPWPQSAAKKKLLFVAPRRAERPLVPPGPSCISGIGQGQMFLCVCILDSVSADDNNCTHCLETRLTKMIPFSAPCRYNLTLQTASGIQSAVHGNFSGEKAQEILCSKGKALELLRPDKDGKLRTVHRCEEKQRLQRAVKMPRMGFLTTVR